MSRYLLDTNVLGDFLRGRSPSLVARMTQELRAQHALISVITRAEVRYGQRLMLAGDKRSRQIDLLLGQMPTLPWTEAAADRYGQLKAMLKQTGQPIGDLDTQIAAHALTEGLTLVTHNVRHFERAEGLVVEDWLL